MSALTAAMLARDFDGIAADYPGTLTVGASSIVGTISPTGAASELQEGSIEDADEVAFVGKVTDFPARPRVNDRVAIAGVYYTVADVIEDLGCYTLRLTKDSG